MSPLFVFLASGPRRPSARQVAGHHEPLAGSRFASGHSLGVTHERPSGLRELASINEQLESHRSSETRAAEKRRHIVQELSQTEASYVAGLKLCLKCYYEPMKVEAQQGKGFFTTEKLNTLFGNLPDVYTFHMALSFQLQERIEDKWDANKTCIGDIFIRSASPLSKLYISYCNNYERAHNFYQSSKTDSKLRQLLQACASHPENLGGAFLTSYLITPVQRLPRYLLLLGDLLKKLPHQHPDYQDVKIAIREVKDIIETTESAMAQVLQANKLMSLQARLMGNPEPTLLEGRKLLRHEGMLQLCIATDSGRLKTDSTPLLFLLFNDMLLWVERKKHRKSTALGVSDTDEPLLFRGRVFLSSHTTLQDVPDSEVLAHAFHLFAAEASLTLTAESVTEKRLWLEQFRTTLQALGSADLQPQQPAAAPTTAADVPVELTVRDGDYLRRQRANGSKMAGPAKFKWVLVFTIAVRTAQGPAPYRIQRDYKQLEELSTELLKQFPKCAFTKLPKKTQRGDAAHLESLKLIVAKFLAELCSRREICQAHLVRDFFSLDDGDFATKKKRSRRSRDEALHRMSIAVASAQLTESFARLAALDAAATAATTSLSSSGTLPAPPAASEVVVSNELMSINAQLFPPLPLHYLPSRSPPPTDRHSRPVSRDDMAPLSPLPTPPMSPPRSPRPSTPPKSPRSQNAGSTTAAALIGQVKSLFGRKHTSGPPPDRDLLPPVPRRPPTAPGADFVVAEDFNPLFGTHEHRNPVALARPDWLTHQSSTPPPAPLASSSDSLPVPPVPASASSAGPPIPPTASWTAAEPDKPMTLGRRKTGGSAPLRSPRERGGTVVNGVLLTFDKRSPRSTTDPPPNAAALSPSAAPTSPPVSVARSAVAPSSALTQSQPLPATSLSPRGTASSERNPTAAVLRVARPPSLVSSSSSSPTSSGVVQRVSSASSLQSPPLSPTLSPLASPRSVSPFPTPANSHPPPSRPTSGVGPAGGRDRDRLQELKTPTGTPPTTLVDPRK